MKKICIDCTYRRKKQKVALNGNVACTYLSSNPCGIGSQKSQLTKGLLINYPVVERKTVNAQTDWFIGIKWLILRE